MARKRTVIKIFWRSSLILKMVTSRIWPSELMPDLTSAEAEAMIAFLAWNNAKVKRGRKKGKRGLAGDALRWRVAANPSRIVALYCSFAGRGFILLRAGFLGGGMTSVVPPLALIFSRAD